MLEFEHAILNIEISLFKLVKMRRMQVLYLLSFLSRGFRHMPTLLSTLQTRFVPKSLQTARIPHLFPSQGLGLPRRIKIGLRSAVGRRSQRIWQGVVFSQCYLYGMFFWPLQFDFHDLSEVLGTLGYFILNLLHGRYSLHTFILLQ